MMNRNEFLLEPDFSSLGCYGKIALAVSGGADSLALLVLYAEARTRDSRLPPAIVLTVDHGLRPEAGEEAEYVGEISERFGLIHHTLCWVGEKPEHGVQNAARNARYALMFSYMKEVGAEALVVAHHLDDQWENFFIRLARGSGVLGLASMSERSDLLGCPVHRPLLDFRKAELEDFLKERKIDWCNDPSNENDKYLRVRFRKMMPVFDELGLTTKKISTAIKNLSRASNFIVEEVKQAKNQCLQIDEKGNFHLFSPSFLSFHEEIRLRILADVLKNVGGTDHQARLEKLERLDGDLRKYSKMKATLNNVIIYKNKEDIAFTFENRNKN